jgi:chromosome segregation ATPase
MHYENIPSSLAKYRSSFVSNHSIGWLNASDMSQWLIEQDKDLTKLGKHIEFLSKNNEIIKTKLAECDNSIADLNENEKSMKKQLKESEDIRSTILKQYEKKLNDQKNELNNQIKQLNKAKDGLESEIASLKTAKKESESRIDELSLFNKFLQQKINQ